MQAVSSAKVTYAHESTKSCKHTKVSCIFSLYTHSPPTQLTGQQLLSDAHQVIVVSIGHVELAGGELRIVCQINTCMGGEKVAR